MNDDDKVRQFPENRRRKFAAEVNEIQCHQPAENYDELRRHLETVHPAWKERA
jgi:hypothetical protein